MSQSMPIVGGLADVSSYCSGDVQVYSRSPLNGGAAG